VSPHEGGSLMEGQIFGQGNDFDDGDEQENQS
jgi:hypothetical protein